jgi:LysM repeat protein
MAPDRPPTLPRPIARTTPVILDHGRMAITMPAIQGGRSIGQAALVILMVLAFALIVVAKLSGGGGSTPVGAADASPTARPTADASLTSGSARPTTDPTLAPSADPAGSPASSADPGSSASPAGATAQPATQTYKVKSGDTLIGIAAKFGTTPKAIAKLNNITNTANLRIGQVLKIP